MKQMRKRNILMLLSVSIMMILSSGDMFSQMAVGKGKFLGNVWGGFGSPPLNYDIYWNQITPENATKWGSVEGTRDSYDWARADEIYNYCFNKQYPFKFHTLVWGGQFPNWVASLDSTSIVEEVEEWIRLAGERYISASFVDVVNEPLHQAPPTTVRNALGGNGATGWDWVIRSFELARQHWDKNVKLHLNDYGIINDNNATQAYLTIINHLKDRGLIDGIGVQGHRFELENASITTITNNLNALAATGLPIYITELDVQPGNVFNDNTQLTEMQRIFPVLWNHPGVKGITFWGYLQGLTWQTNAYLVTQTGTERPAMQWLKSYIASYVSDVTEISGVPTEFTLSQNYPNPFNPSTTIRFSLPVGSSIRLLLFNALGQEIQELAQGEYNAGQYQVTVNIPELASGVYFYRLETNTGFVQTKQLSVLK